MSLKHRNIIAVILIMVAAFCWSFGQQMLDEQAQSIIGATTVTGGYLEESQVTIHPAVTHDTRPPEDGDGNTVPTTPGIHEEIEETDHSAERMIGFALSFVALAAGIIAIFVLSQKNPIFGPDGICMLTGVAFFVYDATQNMDYMMWTYVYDRWVIAAGILRIFLELLFVRELWGWILARVPTAWCLVRRIFLRYKRPQYSLLFSAAWITAAVSSITYLLFIHSFRYCVFPICCFAGGGVFGILQLWSYGVDLHHFKTQLDHYQQGAPITVGKGAFSNTEAQLLDVQAQHEEALCTAVTSERFKVELISNVSHDLRTPLTSILGYSELLQKEVLSPDGQEQLQRLYQKAAYMNELVESLFELTKVSSGVIETQKEEIDLIRLLEQTIGLFDDQLLHAGLFVRRIYVSDSVLVVTDGSRMHQVFANLLGNAIKYAMTGTRIYLEVKETESSFLVRMINTASYEMDFKPEEIMQRFARGDKARSTKGNGLGLAIAQTYTESVGGSFRVGVDGDQFSAIVELPKIERKL